MKRFFTLSLLVALFALLLMPTSVEAKGAPALVLKTTATSVAYAPGSFSPANISTAITFSNYGVVPLDWQFYPASDFGGCAIAAPRSWLKLQPEKGSLNPRTATEATIIISPKMLPGGTHNVDLCLMTNDPFHRETIIPLEVVIK